VAERGDAGCHDRHSAGQVLSQLVIERANTHCSRVHVDSPLLQFIRHAGGRHVKDGYACIGLGLSGRRSGERPEGSPYLAAGLIRAMADRCRIMLGQSG
jgi:hypothetical protein